MSLSHDSAPDFDEEMAGICKHCGWHPQLPESHAYCAMRCESGCAHMQARYDMRIDEDGEVVCKEKPWYAKKLSDKLLQLYNRSATMDPKELLRLLREDDELDDVQNWLNPPLWRLRDELSKMGQYFDNIVKEAEEAKQAEEAKAEAVRESRREHLAEYRALVEESATLTASLAEIGQRLMAVSKQQSELRRLSGTFLF